MLRAMSVGGELASTAQAGQRQAVIQQYMDRDPHLQYTMVSRSAGAPETPPAQEAVLSVTLGVAGQEIRIDGSERYPSQISGKNGRGGIRTLETAQRRLTVFKTAAFNRSATLPGALAMLRTGAHGLHWRGRSRRGGRVAEGTRLLSEYGDQNSIAGSNPALSVQGRKPVGGCSANGRP
jgi:hypothetical protein